jgi:hypothetical protein
MCSPLYNMPDKSRMMITVRSPAVETELGNRVRELRPLLRNLLPYSSLLKGHITPFRLVLSYLDGGGGLTQFTGHAHDTTLLLHFAQTWSVAAKMVLPTMQNWLVSMVIEIHKDSLGTGKRYPVDDNLLASFRHLYGECG